MFNLAYWKSTAEYVVTAFVTAFVGTIVAQQKFTSTSLIAAATAGGLGALTVLVKQLGGVQAIAGTPKVAVSAKVAAK